MSISGVNSSYQSSNLASLFKLNNSKNSVSNSEATSSLFKVDTSSTTSKTYTAEEIAKIDAAFAEMLSGSNENEATNDSNYKILQDITSGGMESYWSWQIDNLKSQLADTVMSEMGIDKDSLSAMSDTDRVAAEQKIMEEVQKKLEEVIKADTKETQKQNFLSENMLSDDVVSTLLLGM